MYPNKLINFTIGQIAKAAEVNVETIRYYERRGLIKQPTKPTQGYRLYPESTLIRVLFIKRAQELGFTLKEILNLIEISVGHCSEIQEIAENKLKSIKNKIKDLKRLSTALETLVEQCRTNSDSVCYIPANRRLYRIIFWFVTVIALVLITSVYWIPFIIQALL